MQDSNVVSSWFRTAFTRSICRGHGKHWAMQKNPTKISCANGTNTNTFWQLLPTDGEDEEEDEEDEDAEVVYREHAPLKRPKEAHRSSKSRKSSTSSISSDTSVGGVDTPVIQSDDEEVHADTLLLTSAPNTKDEETEEEDEEGRCLVSKSSWRMTFTVCTEDKNVFSFSLYIYICIYILLFWEKPKHDWPCCVFWMFSGICFLSLSLNLFFLFQVSRSPTVCKLHESLNSHVLTPTVPTYLLVQVLCLSLPEAKLCPARLVSFKYTGRTTGWKNNAEVHECFKDFPQSKQQMQS